MNVHIFDTPVHKLTRSFGVGHLVTIKANANTTASNFGHVFVQKRFISNKTSSSQEQLEHAEVSTALRYLGQYYFKNKLYDEASLCAQRCCDYNDVSVPA